MDFIRQNWLLVTLAVVSGLGLLATSFRRGGAGQVTPTEATLLINREDAIVLDVREPAEFSAGHIPESRNVPLAKLDEKLPDLASLKERCVIVACAAGTRSEAASAKLRRSGFTNVRNLAGGLQAWAKADLPVTKKGK